ncbi:MAG: YbjN domain-containing protein [Planktothrix sp. GU0601_MAG3]|nr:MAG: YbjN domain-containing protein [Planktothrix sp. GU0601_MAG3]
MATFITLLNYGTVVGNFEMNFQDGELRYKTSLDAEDAALNPALIKHLIYTSVSTMDDYLPGILSVIYGNISPEEAFQRTQY